MNVVAVVDEAQTVEDTDVYRDESREAALDVVAEVRSSARATKCLDGYADVL